MYASGMSGVEKIERILAELRQQVQQHPLLRSMVELVVAVGEELLRSSEDASAAAESNHKQDAGGHSTAPAADSRNETGGASPEHNPPADAIREEDLRRLIEHFQGGSVPERNNKKQTPATVSEQSPPMSEYPKEPAFDVELVTTRVRLKAEVARWRADCLRGEVSAEAETRYYERAVQRAQALPQCYLWMLNFTDPPTLLDFVADCYDALAEVAEVIPLIPRDQYRPAWAEQVLELTAAAQSALHRVLLDAGLDLQRYPDPDQYAVYNWLQWYTKTYHKYIARHMTLRDPADYTHITEIVEKLDALREQMPSSASAQDEQPSAQLSAERPTEHLPTVEAKKHLRTLRYHVGQILRQRIDPEHHWLRIRQEIEALVTLGVPPSNVKLRAVLLPIVEDFPIDTHYRTTAVQLVLREIDRYRMQQSGTVPVVEEPSQPSEEVLAVRAALEGKCMVLIGGDERPAMREAIEGAFGCRLEWVPTRPHESLELFEPYVKRSDVAVVLLAIRWASHSYADVADLCKRYGRPFVRLPGGYNPNQIAAQILQQAGDTLGLNGSGGRT